MFLKNYLFIFFLEWISLSDKRQLHLKQDCLVKNHLVNYLKSHSKRYLSFYLFSTCVKCVFIKIFIKKTFNLFIKL